MRESSQYLHPPIVDTAFPVYVELQHYQQAGQLFYSHWHEHMEMILMIEGHMTLTCNAHVIQAQPGDILIINPNDVHHFYTTEPQVSYYCIAFDLSFLKGSQLDTCDMNQIMPLASNQIAFHHKLTKPIELTQAMMTLVTEYNQQLPAYQFAIKAQLYHILAILFRSHVDLASSATPLYKRRSNLKTIRAVLEYIHNHFTEDFDLKRLSDHFNISYYHLSHLFKDYTGRSFMQYITALRIEKATQYLNHTDLTITEIAALVGYNDVNYFSRVYKREKSYAPSKEKRQPSL